MRVPHRSRPGHLIRSDLELIIHEILDEPLKKSQPVLGALILTTITNTIIAALHRGEDVEIPGFGKFYVYKPREFHKIPIVMASEKVKGFGAVVRSPIPVTIPGRNKVYFSPSVQLTAMINHEEHPTAHERRAIAVWDK